MNILQITASGGILFDTIKIDTKQCCIINKLKKCSKENFIFNSEEQLWVCYVYNKPIKLIDLLFPDIKIIDFTFINLNFNDYQTHNIELNLDFRYSNIFDPPKKYTILEYGSSYHISNGRYAGQYRNMYWKVQDTNNEIYYLMHIVDEHYTKISLEDISKVLTLNNIQDYRCSWYLQQNGYISTTLNNKKQKIYYLHQLIMNVHDEDLSTYERTVDHINRDKLDNRKENLRLVNMSIQNSNRDKQKRQKNAIPLPEELFDGLSSKELPKYVVYRKEILNESENKYREYFYICGHPKLDRWETTKSNKISIQKKLELAIEKINELDNEANNRELISSDNELDLPTSLADKELDLPTYITLTIFNDKYHLVYDYKNTIRYSLKMVLTSNNIQNELDIFIKKINKKYININMDFYIIQNKNIKLDKDLISIPKLNNPNKIILPPNFSLYKEKECYYLQYSKMLNKEKINKKIKITSNNLQEEFNNLILILKIKYPNLLDFFPENYNIPEYHNFQLIPLQEQKQEQNLENESNLSESINEKDIIIQKPIMPSNFSICNVNNVEYIQFCKKNNSVKQQYKTKINSYDLQSELNNFVKYLIETYSIDLPIDNFEKRYLIINKYNWQTKNKIISHEDTELKIKNREKALKSIEKKKQELGHDEYKKIKNEYMTK